MAIKAVFILALSFVLVPIHLSWGGPLVFGPQRFTQPGETATFAVANPVGTFWLQVSNGEGVPRPGAKPGIVDMQNLVTSGNVRLNGALVASVRDFDHNTTLQFGFQKDVALNPSNTMVVELQGPTGSFVNVEIREAEPNSGVQNPQGDLWGGNMGDQILFNWVEKDGATEYIIYRSTSTNGSWEELSRINDDAARTSGGKVDVTPDARVKDLCYKVEAINDKGNVIKKYEPICVPKFVER